MAYPEPPRNKSEIKRAGQAIARGDETPHDIELVDQWRASHGYVINTFQAWLKGHLQKVGVEAEFAQRLKRRRTVVDKLRRTRPDGTYLIGDVTSMNDFAGCRIIFRNIEDLQKFRRHIRSSKVLKNVKHTIKNKEIKYDYITAPKPSGYRGIHEVFRHNPRPHRSNENTSTAWNGLLVEIQLRTEIQHAWATAVEISDITDNQRTKFELYQSERGRFFAIASEIMARKLEGCHNAYTEREDDDLIEELRLLERDLGIMQRLRLLRSHQVDDKIKRHNVLSIRYVDGTPILEVENFRSPRLAIDRANVLESSDDVANAVYVHADAPLQIRSAYRNYFNDPRNFIGLLETAIG